VRKPPKPMLERVARIWAQECAKEGKKVDWQRLIPPRGYVALPRRWVVERTFSWLGQNRRMSLEGVMNFSPYTVASGHGYSKTIPQ
jgi:transposase